MAKVTAAETQQAVRDLRLKVRLENTFRPEVKSIFAMMLKDFFAAVASGKFPSASDYQNAWEFVVKKHINRTQTAFLGTVDQAQKLCLNFGCKAVSPENQIFLRQTLLEWKNERALDSSRQITQTNQRMYERSLQEAREFLIESGQEITNQSLATTATRIAKRKAIGRVTTIAMNETQAAAETAKLLEAQALSGLRPSLTGLIGQDQLTKTKKAWVTMGDDLVRKPPKSKFNHVAANGQLKNLNEPYIVSGERLMQPGDKSLGASDGNIFNCRCSSQYRIAVA